MHMIWVRKGVVLILSLLLFICLIGGALSTSAKVNLTHPAKLETWLGQSHFYTSAVNNAISDAQQNTSNDAGAGRVSLNDPAMQQAIKSVFTPNLLQNYTSTILDANYAWLQGKTATPNFKVDLTEQKEQLAKQIGQVVETRVNGLPACSAAQIAQLESTLQSDPLVISCRLPDVTGQTAGQQATKQIKESSDFLSSPIITPQALNPNGGNTGKPYYQKMSNLPKLYRLNQMLPWIFGVISFLSLLTILFISLTKRRGLRRIGWVLLSAGLILIIVKFIIDIASKEVEKKILSNVGVTQLEQSLTDFLHRLAIELAHTEFWIGIVYIVLALIILAIIWFTRDKTDKPKSKKTKKPNQKTDASNGQGSGERPPLPAFKKPTPSAPPPKRPRLIQ